VARIAQTMTGTLDDHNKGTDDSLVLPISLGLIARLYGDAKVMTDHAQGGDDTLTVPDDFDFLRINSVRLSGDAGALMDGHSKGGDDYIVGASGRNQIANKLIGDVGDENTVEGFMLDHSHGGNDILIGGDDSAGNLIYGDAAELHDHSLGGDDLLIGGANSINYLFGDGERMVGWAHGGNDTLIGGDSGFNQLVGDAERIVTTEGRSSELICNVVCGNDTLISGIGNDTMYGDYRAAEAPQLVQTGQDTFVFDFDSGHDTIFDFRQSDGDLIDVSAMGYHSFEELNIVGNVIHFEDTVITFPDDPDGGPLPPEIQTNYVTLENLEGPLVASDFIFA
jgi:serralysin